MCLQVLLQLSYLKITTSRKLWAQIFFFILLACKWKNLGILQYTDYELKGTSSKTTFPIILYGSMRMDKYKKTSRAQMRIFCFSFCCFSNNKKQQPVSVSEKGIWNCTTHQLYLILSHHNYNFWMFPRRIWKQHTASFTHLVSAALKHHIVISLNLLQSSKIMEWTIYQCLKTRLCFMHIPHAATGTF